MSKRRAQDPNSYQTAIDFAALPPEPEPVVSLTPEAEASASESISEPAPEYSVTNGWIDAAGKQRTWQLLSGNKKLGEITTKSGAQRIADLLNGVDDNERGRSK